jgi:hypothetical protein
VSAGKANAARAGSKAAWSIQDPSVRAFVAAFLPFFAALLLLAMPVGGSSRSWPIAEILEAIRQVESGGRDNPPDGDDGRAIGPYQIHFVYWLDAKGGDAALGGTYEDCRDRAYAERVILAYMRRYAADALSRGDAETIARVHNGGPMGPDKHATLGYWQRVLRHL